MQPESTSSARVDAVIFDLDGTLIDSEPLYEQVDQEFLLSKGVLLPDTDWSTVVGMGGRAFVAKMKDRFGLPEDVESLVAEKDELYLARSESVTLFPAVFELVRYVYVRGVPIAIATSSRRVVLERMMERTRIGLYFDVTASADDVRHLKPDPEIYLRVADALGVEPQRCLVLEDSRYGVAAANAAGMRTIGLPGPDQDSSAFEQAAMVIAGGAGALLPEAVIDRFFCSGEPEVHEPTDDQVRRFRKVVFDHAARHPRPMPWRLTDDPYKILLSEFMLQQTQVKRVVPKYTEFIERFPTVRSLAEATAGEVLAMWQGLGYNRRGKFLHSAARAVVERHGGHVPASLEELQNLPGVGEYTAAAVMAFAFHEPVVVVETNIRRAVLHLLCACEAAVPEASVRRAVARLVDSDDPRRWYYAFMDYGAYLGRLLPNRNRRSAAYTRQSRFEGSVRQVRGQIVRVLTQEGALDVRRLEERLGPGDDRFGAAVDGLLKEGLVERREGRITLP